MDLEFVEVKGVEMTKIGFHCVISALNECVRSFVNCPDQFQIVRVVYRGETAIVSLLESATKSTRIQWLTWLVYRSYVVNCDNTLQTKIRKICK